MRRLLRTILGSIVILAAGAGAGETATLFGLVDTGEIFSSTDGGANWNLLTALPLPDAMGLVAGVSPLDLYLVSTSGTSFHSDDGGSTWNGVGAIAASDVAGFVLGPFGEVLALTRSGTLYSSTDHGLTFTPLAALTGSNWVDLARQNGTGRLFALARTGEVLSSTDQGVTWNPQGALTASNAVSLRAMGSNLFILTSTGEVAKSMDEGITWVVGAALTQSGMTALLDPDGSHLVAAAETGEIAVSPDGATWDWVGTVNQLRLQALASDTPTVTGIGPSVETPRFVVRAPSPNPTSIGSGGLFSFTLAGPDRVTLELYDVAGRRVAARSPEWFSGAGPHSIRWAPGGLAPGSYVVRYVTSSRRTQAAGWVLLP